LRNAFEEAIYNAVEAPSADHIRQFYQLFLKTEMVVPCRMQIKPIKNLSPFPSPFSNLLTIVADEQETIPVFTSEEELLSWAKEPMEFNCISGKVLCERAPESAWISINPSGEWGKELSAWEISLLKQGEESFDELVAEQLQESDPHVIFKPLLEEQKERISAILEPILEENPTIISCYGGTQVSESSHESYLIGVLVSADLPSDTIRTQVHDGLQNGLIGDLPFTLAVGTHFDASPELALLKFSDPIVKNTQQVESLNALKKVVQRVGKWFSK